MRDVIAATRPQSSFREIVEVYSSSGVEVVGVGKKDEEFSKEGDWKRGKDRERSRDIITRRDCHADGSEGLVQTRL